MKKSLSFVLAGIAVLLGLALTVPFLISFNQYKDMIESEFAKATGRSLKINGNLRLSLLPTPGATLNDVVIANPPGTASKEFATIKQIDVGVALTPLLKKQVHITHIKVEEPAVTLETLADGSNNWNFTPANKAADTTAAATQPASQSGGLSIDDLSLEKAYIRIVNVPAKSQSMIGPIDGKFKVDSAIGPFSGRGSITMNNIPVRYEMKVDTLPADETQAIPFTLGLNIVGGAATADLKGAVTRKPEMAARVEAALIAKHLDKVMVAMTGNKDAKLPAILSPQTSLTGVIDYSSDTAKIGNLQLNSGGMEVTGSVLAEMKERTTVTIDLNRMTLPPEQQAAKSAELKSTASKPLAESLREGFNSAAAFLDTSLPVSPVDLVFTASQLALPDAPAMRDVRVAASLGADTVTLQTVEAKMAGDTTVKLNGTLPRQKDGKLASANINAAISSANISAVSGSSDGEKMPLQLTTTIKLTREALQLSPFSLVQKGETVNGAVTYQPKADPALQVAIKGSALDLDAFTGKPDAKSGGKGETKAVSTGGDPLAKLKGLQAKINVDLGKVTYQDKTANQVKLEALASDKGITLQTAQIGDLGGMVINATGSVGGISPLKNVSLNATGKTPNLSNTMRALGNAEAQNLGASAFTAAIKGDDKKLDIDLDGTIDQGKVALTATAKNIADAMETSGSINVTHPETATIVRNFGKMSPKANFGAFSLKANFATGPQTLQAKDLVVALGSAGTVQGSVDIKPQGSGRSIDANLKADTLNLAALMGDSATSDTNTVAAPATNSPPWSNEPIDLDGIRGLNGSAVVSIGKLLVKKFIITDFKGDVKFAGDTMNVQQLSGQFFDAGKFGASGKLTAAPKGSAHRGEFTFNIDDTDAKKLFNAFDSKLFEQGRIDAVQKITFGGASMAQIVGNLDGGGDLKVTNAIMNGIDLDALAAKLDRPNSLTDFAAIMDTARAGGQTKIGDVTIRNTIKDGLMQIADAPIKTQKTAMDVRGTIDLPRKTADLAGQITFTEQRNLPPLTLFVKGPISNPQKSFDTRSFTSFYAQKATEKLQQRAQDKIQEKLGDFLGVPKAQPTPAPVDAAPATPDAMPAPAETAPAPAAPKSRDDQLKELGGQMLNNLLNGGM